MCSVANVVYASRMSVRVTVTIQGEVLTTTTINSDERDPQAIRNRLNLLLVPTLASATPWIPQPGTSIYGNA